MRLRLLACLSLVTLCAGCNYVVLLGYLIGGPPSIEPEYDSMTGNSMTSKDVVVAVAVYAPKEVRYNFSHVDRELSKFITRKMLRHDIVCLNPDAVQQWLDEHPNWDEPEEIGRGVGATHVVYVDLTRYTLFDGNNHELYWGKAECDVTVYELDEDGEGEPTYSKELMTRFPLAAPQSTSDISRAGFQYRFMTRITEEIGRCFYEHFNGDDISDAT